jgi:hypothetical protein
MDMSLRVITMEEIGRDLKIDPYVHIPDDPLGLFRLEAYVPWIVEDLMLNGPQKGKVIVQFSDGTTRKLGVRQTILNILIKWRILLALREPVLPSDIRVFPAVTPNVADSSHNEIYEKYIEKPDIYTDKLMSLLFESVSTFRCFIMTYLWEYASSISLMSMSHIAVHPAVKSYCELELDKAEGTKVAEERIERAKNAFLDQLTTGELRHTSVGKFLQANTLNVNQIGQVFIALGPRSDTDDTIIPTPISRSVLQGFNDTQSFAIETTAAKKAAEANKNSVWDAQYFARTGHLAVSILSKVYPGHCGNMVTDPYYVSPDYFNTLIGKNIRDKNKIVTLTPQNIRTYIGKEVQMHSILRCNCKGGVCKFCAGTAIKYVLPKLHLGLACGSDLFSIITQFILSTKHLIKTNTIQYTIDEFVGSWLSLHQSSLNLKDVRFGEKYKLGINKAEMGSLSSLASLEMDSAEAFSRISELLILDQDDNPVTLLGVENNSVYPWLSPELLHHMKLYHKQLTVTDNNIVVVPMKKWTPQAPILNYTVFTYDMKQYVNTIKNFLKQGIVKYTDASAPLQDLCNIIFKKTQVNILLVEVIIKALIHSIDTEHPDQPIQYSGLVNAIGEKALTPKFLFQGVFGASEQYITKPDLYIYPRELGLFGWFFGRPDTIGKY